MAAPSDPDLSLYHPRINLQRFNIPEPVVKLILERSEMEWLEYDALRALFRAADNLPLSTVPAEPWQIHEGLFRYDDVESIDYMDWEFDAEVVLPGERPISYIEGKAPGDILHRRVYKTRESPSFFVHYLSIEKEESIGVDEDDDGDEDDGDEDDDEDDGDDDDNNDGDDDNDDGGEDDGDEDDDYGIDWDEVFIVVDPDNYVDRVGPTVKAACLARDLQGPHPGSDVPPSATTYQPIISIAIEDAWEHILTCLSRIEHLPLLGEGASYFASSETEEKKALGFPNLKKKGALQNSLMMAVVRDDSSGIGPNMPALVRQDQIIAILNLLDQIGSFQLNNVYAHSQRLKTEAVVAFVRALCKVSITELQSPTDPRVFSLTKAHYNMNRLFWSRILSDFFVSVGLSENVSVAIFGMDLLRQLSMKFLEREELANYNFQNEFLRPFVIVMQKSSSAEIRELIVRCISQMVLSRLSNVKSGWKSVFKVFTIAAADERKEIVLLAFETMEKIVRENFSFITEMEATAFTDCVRCLITFTNSKFNDVSVNAIAFLRFCTQKLAEGGLLWKKVRRACSILE